MKSSISVILIAALYLLPSCEKVVGEGPLVTETRSVGNFTGISMEMAGKVNFTIGSEYRVELTAQRNILDVLQTNVASGVLHIDFKDNVRAKNYEEIIVNITAPSLNDVRLSGSGDINVHGNVATSSLKVLVSGSGNISIQNAVVKDKIRTDVSGSGNISILNGSATDHDMKISGSGNVDMVGVIAQNASIRISGSGDVKVQVSKRLDAHISGSGSVYYRGNPIISTQISGSGRVLPY
jgi:hypothetical protein